MSCKEFPLPPATGPILMQRLRSAFPQRTVPSVSAAGQLLRLLTNVAGCSAKERASAVECERKKLAAKVEKCKCSVCEGADKAADPPTEARINLIGVAKKPQPEGSPGEGEAGCWEGCCQPNLWRPRTRDSHWGRREQRAR